MRSMPPSPARQGLAAELGAGLASFRIGLSSAFAAWPVLAGRALFFVLIMLVLGAFWDKVAAARLAGTLARALPPGGLAVYVGVTEWITLSVVAVHLRLEDDIRSGALEPHLLRPKAYLVQKIAEAFGGMAARLIVLGATALAMLAVSGRTAPPPAAWPLILLLGVLGAAIGVMLYVLVGLTAFWVRRVLPALLIVQKLMFLLGGLFAPISLYPDWLRRLAEATPFAAHLAGVLGGHPGGPGDAHVARGPGQAHARRGVMRAVSTYAALIAAAIRTSLADRTNFLLQAGGMLVNNGFFLLLWFMFFAGFRSVGGWELKDVALLLGIGVSMVGVSGVFFGGYRDMAAVILAGEPDALLTQPWSLLPRLLARESIASAWGDLVTGAIMLAGFADITLPRLPLIVIGVAAATTVYVSAAVAFASMAFWVAGARSFARDLTDFTLLFSSYPGSIYSGATKVIAYTVLPAGFIVLAPVRLLREPGWQSLAVVVVSAAAYAVIATAAFTAGLTRYRRGAAPAG
jgi:ABC-2 type transport system permease protein